jgi:hypothetical protein
MSNMVITEVPFGTVDWRTVEATEHSGVTGKVHAPQKMPDAKCAGVFYTIG